MLWQLIRFEWRYYLRQPSFYVTSLLFFLMTFFAASSESVQIGGGGEVWGNGPFAISQTLLVMSIFSMFLVVNFVGSTALRNNACQMEELVYSKPLVSWQYQLGRFIGSYAVVALVFAFVPLGTLVGSLMPWVDQERFGPTVLAYYVQAFLMFSLPTLFVLSALFFDDGDVSGGRGGLCVLCDRWEFQSRTFLPDFSRVTGSIWPAHLCGCGPLLDYPRQKQPADEFQWGSALQPADLA
jgi:hypothetical protein